MRWTHVNWPGAGYVSFEDVEGYREHLVRLVSDAPPSVAALASVHWHEGRFESWDETGVDDAHVRATAIVRNDEVLDTPEGLWRRWNHARLTLRFDGAELEPADTRPFDLLAGDVHIARGELDHVEGSIWELRLLLTPTGELAVRFRDVAVEVAPVDERVWTDLETRPQHGWHGGLADGWVEWATPAVRAAAHGDVGGLSLELDGFGTETAGIDDLDPRWGFAPLHAAAWFDRRGAIEALLERGADCTVVDVEGRTALDLARERGSRKAEAVLLTWYDRHADAR